ncbi:hypothetical protein [Moraxella lacunata]
MSDKSVAKYPPKDEPTSTALGFSLIRPLSKPTTHHVIIPI